MSGEAIITAVSLYGRVLVVVAEAPPVLADDDEESPSRSFVLPFPEARRLARDLAEAADQAEATVRAEASPSAAQILGHLAAR